MDESTTAPAPCKWGFLRETQAMADRDGLDPSGVCRTGLDAYLQAIFPEVADWVHDKVIKGAEGAAKGKRPDYRSESLKLIVEFDGVQHYTDPQKVWADKEKTRAIESMGYRVVRIPYFIQLTNDAVETLFDVRVSEPLFPQGVASFTSLGRYLPAYLCPAGLKRMAGEFARFPEQYEANLRALKALGPDHLTGASLLARECSLLCNARPPAEYSGISL